MPKRESPGSPIPSEGFGTTAAPERWADALVPVRLPSSPSFLNRNDNDEYLGTTWNSVRNGR